MEIRGLSNSEASEKLKLHGFNELPSSKPKNIWRITVEVMKEPMFLLLISCGVLYMILGDYREGVIMLSTILLIIGITFYQYRKTERALDSLKNLSSPRALVIRDGTETRIPGREVVPEDVLILHEGDRVPADATVLEAMNLTVDESLLTGESVPVIKSAEANNKQVFSGTLVVQGAGIARVSTTGLHAELGKIATSLKSIEQDETRLQQEMKVLIRRLFLAGMVISVSIVLLFYFTRGNFIQSLLNGLAASMAILPEEFPVVLTVFLALGAWRLSKKSVLTRKSTAIETLGSATVLCSDKTGTITQNKMEVVAVYDGNEIIAKDVFPERRKQIAELLDVVHFASTEDSIDPMEKAFHLAHQEHASTKKTDIKLVKQYPLTKKLFAMTRVHEVASSGAVTVSTKGAPEAILSLCRLDKSSVTKHLQAAEEMGAKGFRVLGVAKGMHEGGSLPDKQHEFAFQFLGLIGLEDPIRPEVPQAIQECLHAGVKVIMITGDYPVTAASIARQAGLEVGKILTGDDLKKMSVDELKAGIKGVHVFARVIPEQKLQIVQALKANGEIVAMTGDGVNDAPALKAAHIGIAMGKKGTDVAREASSLVLIDDNFASIVSAIRLGRRIFDNLQKAMSYIMAIHMPIIGLTLLPAFFPLLPLLLMPLHIVFMELIIDPVCSIAFENEQEEKGIMNRPPRNPGEKFFGLKQISFSIFQGLLLLVMVLTVYFLSINEGHTEGEVRAIAFSSLIIGNIILILADLSKTRSFVAVFMEKNIPAIVILMLAAILLLLIISIPALRDVFSFSFPGYGHFIPSIAGAFGVLLILEAIKFIRNRMKLPRQSSSEFT